MHHIKLPAHFFEDDKLKAIRSQKDGDTVILLYTMLITVAVKSDSDGQLMLCEGIPYDEKILSGILNLPLAVVKTGLELLTKFGLLTVTDSIFSLVNYEEYADIKAVREDEAKTQNGELVFGWNCQKDRAFRDMLLTKELFGKSTGRQYAHLVQSFHEKDNLTPEQAYRIGQEFIIGNEKWRDFQILMSVHTNEEHLHIHYVINSVNMRNGMKWQFSQQDLKKLREHSDELCRKYNLHVIDRTNRGHRSYGEYKNFQNGTSWKAMLAADIVNCLQHAKSSTDFLHRLDEHGLDADFGERNVMFFVKEGTYGLKNEMKCSNYKLMSYGDFSRENITNHFKANRGLLELAMEDFTLLQDALFEIGRALFPNNPSELQDRYFNSEFADFDRMTREEIESYIKQKKLEQLRKKALAEWDKQSCGGFILATIAETLDLIIKHRNDRQNYDYLTPEQENEYEL